jgi:CBS domain-containing protein
MIKIAREKGLLVRDVMTPDVFVILTGTLATTAAALLTERHVSAAPVVAPHGKPVGIVSRADLLDPRHSFEGARVEDAMTRVLYGVRPTDPAITAVRLMVTEAIHRVVVVEDGRLVGVVSAMDILRVLATDVPAGDVAVEYVPLAAST